MPRAAAAADVRRHDPRRRPGRPRRVAVPRPPGRSCTTDAIAVAVHDSPKPPPDRVSLTCRVHQPVRAGLVRARRRRQGGGGALGVAGAGPSCRAPAAGARQPRDGLVRRRGSRPPSARRLDRRPTRAAPPTGVRAALSCPCRCWLRCYWMSLRSRSCWPAPRRGWPRLGVGATLLHVGEVGLVRLDLRRGGGFSLSCPAGSRSAGSPWSRGRPGRAPPRSCGRVSWPLAHQYEMTTRGARVAAVLLAHRAGADAGAPDRVAACHVRGPIWSGKLQERRECWHASGATNRSMRPSPRCTRPRRGPRRRERLRLRSATDEDAQRGGHAAAEHVGQAAALALVEQDEQRQEQAR